VKYLAGACGLLLSHFPVVFAATLIIFLPVLALHAAAGRLIA
jgi:uncharacterized membrane protein YgaE (UPF0421/DUF939 family)